MNSNRMFVALTSGLLTVGENRLADAYRQVNKYLEIDTIAISSGLGAAVSDGGAERLTLRKWVDKQRMNGVKSVRVAVQDDPGADPEQREVYMATGSSGELPILIRVDAGTECALYTQGVVTSPRWLLTPALFVELVDAQSDPDAFWPGVLEEINQFRECNDLDGIGSSALRAHLLSLEGLVEWEVMGEQIFEEVQVEALMQKKMFVIPSGFSRHVEQVKPVAEELAPAVWLEAYDDDDIDASALLRLIEAQDFADRIWRIAGDRRLLVEKLDDSIELDDFPKITPKDWPHFLARMDDDDVWCVSEVLIELVRLECESRGVQPCISEDVAHLFGPDDEERRRLDFHEQLQHDLHWKIRETDTPKALFVLERVDGELPSQASMPVAQARQQFIAALTLALDVAERVDSPVAPVLAAARHLASKAVGVGALDLAILGRSAPDWAPELLPMVQEFTATFAGFGWGADRLLGLAAISAADIFGDMESWNEQAFEDVDEAEFPPVSQKLRTALNRYFEALVSIKTTVALAGPPN